VAPGQKYLNIVITPLGETVNAARQAILNRVSIHSIDAINVPWASASAAVEAREGDQFHVGLDAKPHDRTTPPGIDKKPAVSHRIEARRRPDGIGARYDHVPFAEVHLDLPLGPTQSHIGGVGGVESTALQGRGGHL
jgi:hypothetical protein